jgi:hypothetical protein
MVRPPITAGVAVAVAVRAPLSAGVDPDQGTTVAAGADRRVAACQEGQAAGHLFLGDARPGPDQGPDPAGELGVVGHAG